LLYVFVVLTHIEKNHPQAEKVDFLVERNGQITKHIQAFHAQMPRSLEALNPRLKSLLGELIPGGKDRIPLQAADVLCWHTARLDKTMNDDDVRRCVKFARRAGICQDFTADQMNEMDAAFSRPLR